ncbi:MAG: hypothetical protein KC583_12330, partial [Myxococcales bacterium]|nr:hypothetical protein [Myxococcales bacterium]
MMRTSLTARALLAALLLSGGLAGCSKDDAPKDDETGKQTKAAKAGEAAAPPAAATLEAPADVVAYGGTNDLAATLDALHALARQAVPQVPPLAAMVGPALQGELRLTDPSVIDTKKPIRFAVIDPKAHPRSPVVVLIGITDQAAFEKALPATGKKQNDEGNAWSYLKFEGSTRPIYVNFVDGYVAISRDKALFGKAKDFLGKLATAKMPDLGGAFVEIDNLIAKFGPDFDAGLAQAKQMAAMAAQTTPGGAQQAEMLNAIFDWVGQAARETDHIRLSLATEADGARLDVRFQPKKGSALAKTISSLKGTGAPDLLAKLPADAPVFFAAAVAPEAMADLAGRMADVMVVGPIFGADKAKGQIYVDAMVEYAKAIDGKVAVAAHTAPDGKGLALTGLFGVKDAAAARAAQKKLTGMYTDEAAQAYYQQSGVSVDYKPAAYEVNGVKVDIIATQLNNMPPAAAQFAGMMKELMTQHVAIGEKLGVMAYGTEGKPVVEAALTGKLPGGLDAAPGVQRAVKNAAANTNFLMYVRPIELAKRIQLGGMNPLANALAGVENTTGIAISSGVTGDQMQLVIDV